MHILQLQVPTKYEERNGVTIKILQSIKKQPHPESKNNREVEVKEGLLTVD